MSYESVFSLEENAVIVVLHHKISRGRKLPVVVSLHSSVPAPYPTDSGFWAVPCELVGLLSKKAKQAKVRFHPSIKDLARADAALINAARKTAHDMIDSMMSGTEWTRGDAKDGRLNHLRRVARLLVDAPAHLYHDQEWLEMVWPLPVPMDSQTKTALANHSIQTGIVVEIKNVDDNQELLAKLSKGNLEAPLLRLQMHGKVAEEGQYTDAWKISDECVHIRVASIGKRLSVYPWILDSNEESLTVYIDQRPVTKMLDACQLRVEELRRQLDESLAAFHKSNAHKEEKPRALHIVRRNEAEAMIEIGEPGSGSRLKRLLESSQPLAVMVDGASGGDLATSPTESTDSGVSMSPATSPLTRHAPFYQYSEENRLGMRQRSASESDWGTAGIKGILKKTNAARVNRLLRSVSECHGDLSYHQGNGSMSSLEPMVEEEEDEENEDQPRKRVSFSEKLVQLRRFKSNQSILAQTKKNEKKRLQKRRKEEKETERRLSLSFDEDSMCPDEALKYQAGPKGDQPAMRSERQDSGFGDDDELEDDVADRGDDLVEQKKNAEHCDDLGGPELKWKRAVQKQRSL